MLWLFTASVSNLTFICVLMGSHMNFSTLTLTSEHCVKAPQSPLLITHKDPHLTSPRRVRSKHRANAGVHGSPDEIGCRLYLLFGGFM